jgi:uncharacterized protein YggU (UPF0235/DUF167 family)
VSELLRVRVKPGSSKGPLVESDPEGGLVVYVRERAVEGAANDAVVRIVAEHLGIPRSRVTIRRGHAARIKTLELDR